jgi:hypothetical protein
MNDREPLKDGKKVAGGVAFVIEMAFEVFSGLISGMTGIMFSLIGWIIGLGLIILLCVIGWNLLKDADFSAISENLQTGIDSITEGGSVEGWVSEVDAKMKVPTEEDIAQARQAYDEKAAKHQERTNDPYPFEFHPPKERQVTVVTFRDKRFKEFSGISPKSIPIQQYVIIRYNSWTDTISDVEVVEKPDPLLEKEDEDKES